MSIKLCVHPPREGFTMRKSWGTMRYTRPSYYVCTHYEEVSPWENLVGPRVFLMIKRLFSRSIGVNYVNQTMCASTTRRFHREKILRDHEIYSSIILCVHPPRGDLTSENLVIKWLFSRSVLVNYVNQTMYASTTNKSWGTTRSRSILVNYVSQTMCASITRRFHREKILRDHDIYSSIILCVHPPRGDLTVGKSCGTTRFSRDQNYFLDLS